MGPVDSPAVTELSENLQFVTPSEDRAYSSPGSLPKEPFWANDVGMADDAGARSEFIKLVQQKLKNNPIGPSYSGPIDGKETRHLKDIAIRFGWDLKKKTGKTIVVTPGDRISESAFPQAWNEMEMHLAPKKEPSAPTAPVGVPSESRYAIFDAFEAFFSMPQPIIGKLYTKTGNADVDLASLVAAAKQTESIIAKALDNNKVGGMIWNSSSKSFNTDPSDVKSALELIMKHKKVALFDKKDRKLALSSFISL